MKLSHSFSLLAFVVWTLVSMRCLGDSSSASKVACPPDFDEFWRTAIERLEATTPLDLQIARDDARSRPDFDYFRFSFATAGRRMWGFMTVPTDRSKKKFPFLLHLPGAGPYHSSWWGGNAHRITMLVNVLDFDPNDPEGMKAGYEKMCERLRARDGYTDGSYMLAGLASSREDAFFYPVLLGLNRIVEWVWNRPDVDRSQFGVIGGSQGGFLTIALLGLNHRFTRAAPYVPAMGDLLGEDEGRVSGSPRPLKNYPRERHDAIRKIAPYFDAVNFASRVTTPIRGARGLADTTCSPSSTKLIFDAIASREKYVIDCPGMTHKVFPVVERGLGAWANSATLRVDETAIAGDDPSIAVSGEFHETAQARDAGRVSPRESLRSRLIEVGKSRSFYWAWTHPWLDHSRWSGDDRFVVREKGKVLPKPTEQVELSCVYQKYSDGRRALINYSDIATITGTWHSREYYRVNRACLTAAIKRQWKEFGGVQVLSWHMDHPYCTNGFGQASYRFKSEGENRNVIGQILSGTGSQCGTACISGVSHPVGFASPRDWYLASLNDLADFLNGLVDEESGRKIPVIIRYPHECDGDWFWWGRGWCSTEEFRSFCRMQADYLRKACGDEQILFAYTPDRTWTVMGKEGDVGNTFLAYYPGDRYVDIIGLDDYSIGNGDDEKVGRQLQRTVERLRQMTDFARSRNQVVVISEAGGKAKRDDFWRYLHRAATADGVDVAFVDTWAGEWGTLPLTKESEQEEVAFSRLPSVLMEGKDKGFR